MADHPSQRPRRPRKLQSREHERYQKMLPHLMALVRLEYCLTGQKQWPLKCQHCGATAALPNVRVDQYHTNDCPWHHAWRLYPPLYLAEFDRYWLDLSVNERLQIRGLQPR